MEGRKRIARNTRTLAGAGVTGFPTSYFFASTLGGRWHSAGVSAILKTGIRKITECMIGRGFSPARDSFSRGSRPDGVCAIDAKPDNFIKTDGGIVPIDLQMALYDPDEMRRAGAD